MRNKNIQVQLEKQYKKLKVLNKRYEYYYRLKETLKNKLDNLLNEYNELNDELKIKENEHEKALKNKEECKKNKILEKTKNELLIKLSQVQQEHIVIKQTYDNYVNEKKNLELKETKLKNKNEQLKTSLNEIKGNIKERLNEKKNLENYLNNKIKEEIQLRQYFEDEFKKINNNNIQYNNKIENMSSFKNFSFEKILKNEELSSMTSFLSDETNKNINEF
jgi:hypothetical protein